MATKIKLGNNFQVQGNEIFCHLNFRDRNLSLLFTVDDWNLEKVQFSQTAMFCFKKVFFCFFEEVINIVCNHTRTHIILLYYFSLFSPLCYLSIQLCDSSCIMPHCSTHFEMISHFIRLKHPGGPLPREPQFYLFS